MPEPHLRAADADRAALATVLGEHMAAGRLTVHEYEDRLGRAYAAKTYGELAELTTDLPSGAVPAVPAGSTAAGRETRADRWHPDWSRAGADEWRSWASTTAIVIAIWATISLASWELRYFWPGWVIGPWLVVLLIQSSGEDDEDELDDGTGTQALPGR